jgi:hypothetical protein
VDTGGDVVMQDAPPIVTPDSARKSASLEQICSSVFGGRRDWLIGGLGSADESDEAYEKRVMDGLSKELDSQRYDAHILFILLRLTN